MFSKRINLDSILGDKRKEEPFVLDTRYVGTIRYRNEILYIHHIGYEDCYIVGKDAYMYPSCFFPIQKIPVETDIKIIELFRKNMEGGEDS